jgi:hypothetical protein
LALPIKEEMVFISLWKNSNWMIFMLLTRC